MPVLLLLLLILALAAPGAVLMVGLAVLLLLPAYLVVSSVFTVVLAPQQILAVASEGRTRRTHACEHATVNVLEEWYGPLPQVGGVAARDGFYIWGAQQIHPGVLVRAAQQGLRRMQAGEAGLALHPRCGTSLVVAQFVFALSFLLGLFVTGYFTLTGILVALLASWAFGRPLGLLAQRYFTTSADVARLRIAEVHWTARPDLGMGGLFTIPRGAFFFRVLQ